MPLSAPGQTSDLPKSFSNSSSNITSKKWGDSRGDCQTPIGLPPATGVVESPNWSSATQLACQVNEIIFANLMASKLLGPFVTPPFPSYIVFPLRAFLKKDGIKIRLIHDLSYPSAESVNIAISTDEFFLQYSSVEDAVRAFNSLDNSILSNIDLKDAYKAIGIAKDDWHLLGLRWSLPVLTTSPRFIALG